MRIKQCFEGCLKALFFCVRKPDEMKVVPVTKLSRICHVTILKGYEGFFSILDKIKSPSIWGRFYKKAHRTIKKYLL